MDNRPRGREKHVTGTGKDVYKRGEGQGTGPVGREDGYQGRADSQSSAAGKRSGGRNPLSLLILLVVVLLGGGGAGLSGLFSGSDGDLADTGTQTVVQTAAPSQSSTSTSSSTSSNTAASQGLAALFGSQSSLGNVSNGWSRQANTGKLSTSVATGARDKRTIIQGNGQDVYTIMVYMCGTDLESKYGMGTSDLQEMAAATISNKVNILVYTGGCRQWKNSTISSDVNQIYKVETGGLRLLENNMGRDPMTRPATLTSFIQYCNINYPANRRALILWDHGGGSVTGYGYDEKNASSGSMNLRGIQEALRAADSSFDFIGFDACLMATLETGTMLTDWADYLIASEETEPGVGWYYTQWLTKLSQNTSMPTTEIGKNIIDDFVATCNQKCQGQKTTLSIVDLAELELTVPDALRSFSSSTSTLISGDEFQTVSTARSGAREFATSSKIDQVDLVDLCTRIGTTEAENLADCLLGCVKYNKTSSSMTNAYGISIYFPYQKTSKVGSAVADYDAIGMEREYARCIQRFASMETGGQTISGASGSPLSALLGSGNGSAVSSDMISAVLGELLGGSFGRSLSSDTENNEDIDSLDLDIEQMASYLAQNRFDASALVWLGDTPSITLSEEQWSLVSDLELNVFLDDGAGYIDLGLDNVFSFTDDGALSGEYDGSWLAFDGQPIPYYHTGTVIDGDEEVTTGRVPVRINGERAELLLTFDTENPYGYISGVRSYYADGETETVAKANETLNDGDVIEFLCDYYTYDGSYEDTYFLGEAYVYHGQPEISNVYLENATLVPTYLFTDIYCQEYWTPAIPN